MCVAMLVFLDRPVFVQEESVVLNKNETCICGS